MDIRQIDIIVHPNYYQMLVPYLPLHKRQLILRKLWNQRFNELEQQKDSVLLYFSYIDDDKLSQGLKDISTLTNKVEWEEVSTIKIVRSMLGNRLILYGWTLLPNEKNLLKTFRERGFVVSPENTKICAYGEVFEMCVIAWACHVANIFSILPSNSEHDRRLSLANEDCSEISKWRYSLLQQS